MQFVSEKKVHVYFVEKAVRLLKSENATQSHHVSSVASQTAAINCTQNIALKSQLVYTREFEVATSAPCATKIALICATKIACVNEPLEEVCVYIS